MKHRLRYVFMFLFLLIPQTSFSQQSPFFWRGMYFFALDTASNKVQFFNTLKDSLNINVYQVKTFDGAFTTHQFFLDNGTDLKVITLMDSLATFSSYTYGSNLLANLLHGDYDWIIKKEIDTIIYYAKSNHFRFYLRDEPENNMFDAWKYVKDTIKHYIDWRYSQPIHNGCVAAFTDTGTSIQQFVVDAQPSELIIDPYPFRNCIPHPSLEGLRTESENAGIQPWEDIVEPNRYGTYFGYVQQYINMALERNIRPAADAAKGHLIPLILAPQLHGCLYDTTQKYDHDNIYDNPQIDDSRPPSPTEIKLQYYIGIAYGTKGFLPFIYRTSRDGKRYCVGLVSQDSILKTQTNHYSNYDTIYGKRIYTGYKEKWDAVSEMNKRLKKDPITNFCLEDTLLALNWIGAKSWGMTTPGWVYNTIHTVNWSYIVTNCTATTPSNYCNYLPQVEVGHLKRGSTDYIVVVNRRCYKTDTATISITMRSNSAWRVTDIEDTSHIWIINGGQSFADIFEPGGGKVFRLDKLMSVSVSGPTEVIHPPSGSTNDYTWSATVSGGTSQFHYVWKWNGIVVGDNSSTCTIRFWSDHANFSEPFTITVQITDANGRQAMGILNGTEYHGNVQKQTLASNDLPTSFAFYPNYPNPFNPSTLVKYELPEACNVSLKIYDILGRVVSTLVSENLPAGHYEKQWNANELPSGIYFCRINANSENGKKYSKVIKMLLMK